MMELLRLFTQIALLRRGPQDIPASPLVLAATVVAYFAVNCAVLWVLPPSPDPWLPQLVVQVLFALAFYALLMRAVKRPERFLQTATALFGFQLVLSPLLRSAGWLVQAFPKESPLVLPVVLVTLGLAIWLVAAGGHVVRAALEWTLAPSVSLFILQMLTTELLAFALFNSPA